VIDGNAPNQSDGGSRLKQLGIYATNAGADGWLFENVTIRDTVYGPVRSRGGKDQTWIDCEFRGHSGGVRWDKAGGGRKAENITLIDPLVDTSASLSSDAIYSGLVLGDGALSSHIVAPDIQNAQADAFLIEDSDNITVTGGTTEQFRTLQSTGLNVSGLTVEGGLFKSGSSRQSNFEAVVDEPSGDGLVIDDPERGNKWDVTVYNAGGTPVKVQGAPRGGYLRANVVESTTSGPGIRLEDASATSAVVDNFLVTGSVYGNGNLTYAVQASDANQEALIAGLAAEGMATGKVDNPGGLTIGSLADELDSQTPTDESANRSLGSWEQNTTGRDLFVSVRLNVGGASYNISMSVNDSQSDKLVDGAHSDASDDSQVSVQAIVPSNHYYRVREGDSNGSINSWYEYTLS